MDVPQQLRDLMDMPQNGNGLADVQQHLQKMADLPSDVYGIIIVLSILVGAVECFFGYRIFKFLLGVAGFLAGGFLAGAIGYHASQDQGFALLTGLVGGIVGAVLIVVLYFVGVFLLGAALGGGIGAALYANSGSEPEPAVLLILAVIAGAVALFLQKFIIVVSTAFAGAWGVVVGITYFVGGEIDTTDFERMLQLEAKQCHAMLLCWLVLGIAGILVQYQFGPAGEKEGRSSSAPAPEPVEES